MKPVEVRKSHMDIGKLYFWTATINNWNKLLEEDELKKVIISSLKYLVANKKIEIYAFVFSEKFDVFSERFDGRRGLYLRKIHSFNMYFAKMI